MHSLEITKLLNKWLSGDDEAKDEIFENVYDELRKLARSYMFKERMGHSLNPTGLVNEAYLKIQSKHPEKWQNRAHFYAFFALTMRHILVDYARARLANKRGGDYQLVALEEANNLSDNDFLTLLEIDSILNNLTEKDAFAGSVFHLKHFVGLPINEIAQLLETNETKVNRVWAKTKLWLQRELRLIKDDSKIRKEGHPQISIIKIEDADYTVSAKAIALIRYLDKDGAPQTYQITRNRVVIGRGGIGYKVDLTLQPDSRISREHIVIRHDKSSGKFFVKDISKFGITVNGRAIADDEILLESAYNSSDEIELPARAEIELAGTLKINFENLKGG